MRFTPPPPIWKQRCETAFSPFTLPADKAASFFGGHRSWALFSGVLLFLFHFPDRHAEFWNIVAFPLAPIGFAQACQHLATFVLDSNHQVVFFCLIGRAFKRHPYR